MLICMMTVINNFTLWITYLVILFLSNFWTILVQNWYSKQRLSAHAVSVRWIICNQCNDGTFFIMMGHFSLLSHIYIYIYSHSRLRQPIRSQHLLYNITVQYNSKSYIVQCSAHVQFRAVKGVIFSSMYVLTASNNVRPSDITGP